ncbi:MAG: dienelactone hydrolase family protein [Candidatus Poribacteria bacterium]|nr:dienelactone hydrolase family protein [Candidatus Poribacteria bacterium]
MKVPNLICTICLALILGSDAAATSAKEQLENSPRHGEWVKIPSTKGRSVNAFIVFPEIKEQATSVIVIHEIFGLTDWVRLVGDRLAEAGFVAICPDMLSGMEGGGTESFESGDDVRRAIRNLDSDQITADLKAAAKYLRDLPSTTDKVAVSGFCWGGGQTFRFAANDDTIAGAFVFYGPPPAGEAIRDIKCPVYGFYGENDNRINATIEPTKAAANAAGVSYEPVTYSGVGHGFLRHGMADGANNTEEGAVEKAWKRFVDLLKAL